MSTEHKIKFERNTLSGNWCANCECGWWGMRHSAVNIIKCADAHLGGKGWVEADPHSAVEMEAAS